MKIRKVEMNNAPHFMRGAILGWLSWVFGLLVWPGPNWALPFTLIFVFLFSVGWELYDLRRGVGFDWKDILFDMLGCGMIQLTR